MSEVLLPRVAVVAANDGLRAGLLKSLQSGGWQAWGTDSVPGFIRRASKHPADLVLVHLDFFDPTASDVLRRLREGPPRGIVALTPTDCVAARSRALDHGADHCLPAAPDPQELHSTLHALWRRLNPHPAVLPVPVERLAVSGWALDMADRTLRRASGGFVGLSDQEAGLLAALMRAPGRVIPKPELLAGLYPGESDPDPHRIEVILSRARRKASVAGITLPVRSVFGKGLSFLPQPAAAP
jgi:two-component system response regulator PhoP